MTPQDIENLCIKYSTQELVFEGACHDCKQPAKVVYQVADDGKLTVEGGAVYKPFEDETFFIKCLECFEKDSVLKNYQPCLVYSRIVGYLTPTAGWNPGKKAELDKRVMFET